MAENTVSHLASIVNEDDLQFFEYQGEILFSSEEIGRQLGYRQPLKSINVLWNRNQKELKGYATGIKLMSRQLLWNAAGQHGRQPAVRRGTGQHHLSLIHI